MPLDIAPPDTAPPDSYRPSPEVFSLSYPFLKGIATTFSNPPPEVLIHFLVVPKTFLGLIKQRLLKMLLIIVVVLEPSLHLSPTTDHQFHCFTEHNLCALDDDSAYSTAEAESDR